MGGPVAYGDLELELEEGVVVRGSERLRLRPRHLQVLRCLLARPGEVVSQDELLAEVWAERYVTDDVVRRAIAGLRRDLGDDAEKPVYIETVPRRGYRWLPAAQDPVPIVEPGPQATGRDTGRIAQRSSYWLVPWLLGLVLAIAVFWLIADRSGPVGSADSDGGPGQSASLAESQTEPIRLLVGSWQEIAEPSLSSETKMLLAITLDHLDGIELVSPNEIELGLNLMRLVAEEVTEETTEEGAGSERLIDRSLGRELSRRLGAHILVLPALVEAGSHHVLDLILVDAASDEVLGQYGLRFSSSEEMLDAVEVAASWVASTVHGSVTGREQNIDVLELATTDSLPALIAYSRGVEQLNVGQISEAKALLYRALDEDPDFTLARLALALAESATAAKASVVAEHLDGLDVSRLSKRERLYAEAWISTLEGDDVASMASWTLYRDVFPKETAGYLNLAGLHRSNRFDYAGCVRELERLDQAHPGILDLEPVAIWRWSSCALALGRDDDLLLERVRRLAQPDQIPPRGLHLLLALGREKEAKALLESGILNDQRALLLHPPTAYRLVIAARNSTLVSRGDLLESLAEEALKVADVPYRIRLKRLLDAAPLAAAAERQDLLAAILSQLSPAISDFTETSDDVEMARYALATVFAECRRHEVPSCVNQASRLAESLPDAPSSAATEYAMREILAGELAWGRGAIQAAEERFRVSTTYADSMTARFARLALAREMGDAEAASEHEEWLRGRRGLAFTECFSRQVCFDRLANILAHQALFQASAAEGS